MATEIREQNERLGGVNSEPTEQTAGVGGSKEDTRTETATDGGRKRGRPRTTTTTENTGSGTAEEKELSGLVVLNNETVPTPAEPKKAKQKRTRNKKTVKNDSVFNAEQITDILMTVSGIMGNTESGKYFAISKKEAEQIAKPLANIIATNESLTGLTEHSDSIALLTACAMIFLPRVFLFLQFKKQQKSLKENGVKLIKGVEKENDRKAATINGNNRPTNGAITTDSPTNGQDTLSAIPSLA